MKVTSTFRDKRAIQKALDKLGPKKMSRATTRAFKKAGVTGRANMSKEIVKDTGMKSKAVKDALTLKADPTSLSITVTGSRIPLVAFGAKGPEPSRGRGRGVSYKLKGGRGRIPTAFLATMPSGHRGVFHRKAPVGRQVRELFGPSLVHVFEKFVPTGAKAAAAALVKNLRSEIAFALSRSTK